MYCVSGGNSNSNFGNYNQSSGGGPVRQGRGGGLNNTPYIGSGNRGK